MHVTGVGSQQGATCMQALQVQDAHRACAPPCPCTGSRTCRLLHTAAPAGTGLLSACQSHTTPVCLPVGCPTYAAALSGIDHMRRTSLSLAASAARVRGTAPCAACSCSCTCPACACARASLEATCTGRTGKECCWSSPGTWLVSSCTRHFGARPGCQPLQARPSQRSAVNIDAPP